MREVKRQMERTEETGGQAPRRMLSRYYFFDVSNCNGQTNKEIKAQTHTR